MDDCIPSPIGRTVRGGHKQIYVSGGKREYAHRVAWEKANGPIPEGIKIRHRCDNPPCINVDHLEPGTQSDNVRDMDKRGRRRSLQGEKAFHSKLTAEQVLEIRSGTMTTKDAAAKYGVSTTAIRYILTRRNWKHI